MAENTDLNIHIKAYDQTKGALSAITTQLNGLSTKWTELAAKLYIYKQAWNVVKGAFVSVTKEAMQQEDAINRLGLALRLQGGNVTQIINKYSDFANSIQASTRYADDAILDVMKTLVTIGHVAPDNMERATKAVTDFATLTGRDLSTAALLVAKAAAGETSSLARYGIVLDDNIPKSRKFAEVLKLIEKSFGGAAENDARTYAGALAKVGNQFGDLLEKIGLLITQSPAVLGFLDYTARNFEKINTSLDKLSKNKVVMAMISGVVNMKLPWFMKSPSEETPDENVKSPEQAKESTYAMTIRGFQQGIKQAQDDYVDFAKNIQTMTNNMLKNMETSLGDFFYDAFTNNLKGAKEIFHSFANAILREWINMTVRASMYGIGGSDGGVSWVGQLLKTGVGLAMSGVKAYMGGGLSPAPSPSPVMADGMGGWTTSYSPVPSAQLGTTYVGRNSLHMLHRGEEVLPPARVREKYQGGGQGITINQVIKAWDFQDVYRNRKMLAEAIATEIKNNAGIRGVIKENK